MGEVWLFERINGSVPFMDGVKSGSSGCWAQAKSFPNLRLWEREESAWFWVQIMKLKCAVMMQSSMPFPLKTNRNPEKVKCTS